MIPGLAVRLGDINDAGGICTLGHLNVFINSLPAAIHASPVTPHFCCGIPGCGAHCGAVVVGPGSLTTWINGLPMIKTLDFDSCGHVRLTGALNVIVS